MIRFFVEYRIIWFFLGPLLIIIFHLLNFFSNSIVIPEPINLGLFGDLVTISPFLSRFLAGILVLINALNLTRIFNENEFHDKTIYSTGFLYCVLISLFPCFYYFNSILLVHVLLIAVFRETLLLKQKDGDQKHVFNGAILLGLCFCIHPPTIIYIIPFFIAVLNLKVIQFRDIFLVIVGLLIPFIYVGSYYFINEKVILIDFFNVPSTWKIIVFDLLFVLIILTFLFLLAFVSLRSNAIKSTLRLRKMMVPVWFFFVFGIIIGGYDLFFFGQFDRFSFVLISLPFFINYALTSRHYRLFAGILFFIALGYSFVKFFAVLPFG
jgi:hypothetical protein